MHIDDPTFDGKNIQEQTRVEESTEKICKVQNIRRLDEPEQRKFGDFHFYCLHCEVHLRNVRHVKDHIRTGEHLANQNRGHDRACLKQYLGNLKKHYHCPTTAHIFALDLFALSICNEHTNNSFLEKQHEQNVRQILNAMEKTLEQAFSKYLVQEEQHLTAVKLCVTGSNLTGMHSVKIGVCTLDIFAKFNEQLKKNNKMSFLYLRTCEVLRDFTRHLHRGTTIMNNGKYCPVNIRQIPPSHYCSAALQFNLLFGPFCYSIKLGFGDLAEQAYLSTRLVLAYCNIWPQLKFLMRFMRLWAEANFVTFQACGGISNFAFDILCIFYLQRTRYLPIIDSFIEEYLAVDEDDPPPAEQPIARNMDQLCRLPEDQFTEACNQLRRLYYGPKMPMLSAGRMIYGFFKYFGTEFDMHDQCDINCLDLVEKSLRADKHFCIIDPFLKVNILKLRLEGNAYLLNCFIKTAAYLCIPRTTEGHLFDVQFNTNGFEIKKSKICYLKMTIGDRNDAIRDLIRRNKAIYEYNFDGFNFKHAATDGLPPISCQFCEAYGHCGSDCHYIQPYPPHFALILPPKSILNEQLTRAIERHYQNSRLPQSRFEKIQKYVEELEATLRDVLALDDLKLTLFGSITNGFGTKNSDLDLCLQSEQLPEEKSAEYIGKISKWMVKEGWQTECILQAKVPIVKFNHPYSGFNGDISIGNCLGIRNSEMLRVYCALDQRVAPLGLFIKQWFKQNNLNVSSNGTFSSYSLIILLIAYLQRGCTPPVLPYLQELAKNVGPREMLEGWDVSFAHLTPKQYLKRQGGMVNRETLAELFIGFMHYYRAKFNPSMDIVQIRNSERLMKIDKNGEGRRWEQYTFCIEDPFDLNHNLTGGVKLEALFQVNKMFDDTRRELALLDKKLSWPNAAVSLANLMQNTGTESGLTFMPKLLGFV